MTLSLLEATAPELVAFVTSGFVVLYGWSGAPGFRAWVDRNLVRRGQGISSIRWDWRIVALVLGVVFVAAAFVQSGPISCSAGEDDTLALLQSGRNFLSGTNPFVTYQCGHLVNVPYGIAGVLLDALGSLGGRVGIWLVWNLVALLLIPLTWILAGPQRWYTTIFVATSMLYVPLVVGSIQGGHSAVVPVAALLGIGLALRRSPVAGAVAGFLSTVKFPSLFPFWGGLSGVGPERWRAFLLSVAVFGVLSVLAGVIWGGNAYSLLFTQQLARADFSINEFGVLIPRGAMPPSYVLEVIQGLALLAALVYVHLQRWSAVPAIALLTVVVALVAQRFTPNFMIWLLPVALLGPAYARWLFAIGAVGVVNGAVALPACLNHGACTLSEGLGGVFGLLLILLLVLILREGSRSWAGSSGAVEATSPMEPSISPETSEPPSGSFHSAPQIEGDAEHDPPPWSGPLPTGPPDG
ncbi:MAG: hypothetical protein WA688_00865 [Thermoplasmata archaeon]